MYDYERAVNVYAAGLSLDTAVESTGLERAYLFRVAKEKCLLWGRQPCRWEHELEPVYGPYLTNKHKSYINKRRRAKALAFHRSGMPFREIAELLHVSESQVSKMVRQAQGLERDQARSEVSRPIDMGGPRGRWITWTPEMQYLEFERLRAE